MATSDEERVPGLGTDGMPDVEKLGRQRPEIFPSIWAELGFGVALLGSMLLSEFFISGFHIILPILVEELHIPEASQTWPSSVFALITGAFLLPMGRIGDKYGGYLLFNAGLLWFVVWCLIAGFSQNYMMLIMCRALQGLGPAAYLPGGVMLLGKIYRPGPRKNFIFGLYGAFAPLGFYLGILVGGISAQLLNWRWYFWIGAIILGLLCVVSLLAIPFDFHEKRVAVDMDWWGIATVVPALLLIVYAITDSSHAPHGWKTPYIIATLVLGVFFLIATWYVETRVAKNPLLPADLFAPKYMKRLMVALFLGYGNFGLYLFYSTFYIEQVLKLSPLLTAVWYTPLCAGGLIIATVGGITLHLLPGRLLLVISAVANLMCVLLFAIIPENPNYWAYVFTSMICATMGIDITYTVSNVFITNNLANHLQGLAGAMINSLLFLGISFCLGIADIAAGQTSHLGQRESYKIVFWLGVGITTVPIILLPFLRIGSAKSDLTVEERQQLEAEEAEAARLAEMERQKPQEEEKTIHTDGKGK
ncbi:major facilitator superfamily-domain-containing protein [Mariannaea sp. PMI_226]|nr:major facilitator superfamily-domain-containing protein [Mariannaea sp. PMI_226]